ncbi:MAG: four helix bundle protein [Chitinophagaceae bacterium]|nr:four helix bundle protein [Chitinophagaceae bacterium]
MAFKFEELAIWHRALDLSVEINTLISTFPSFELYNLANQMRRAADSVVLNIAEGSTGQSSPEFKRFLGYSLRSGIEVVACLFIARKKKYISDLEFQKFYSAYESLCKMITKMRQALM